MWMGVHDHGPRCDHCGGIAGRAVRTRKVDDPSEPIYYLAYTWACTVCGKSWIDERLEDMNARAEDDARIAARATRMIDRKAS